MYMSGGGKLVFCVDFSNMEVVVTIGVISVTDNRFPDDKKLFSPVNVFFLSEERIWVLVNCNFNKFGQINVSRLLLFCGILF